MSFPRRFALSIHTLVVSLVLLCLFSLSLQAAAPSVKKFGAKGDGVADDTAALKRAINATRSGTLTFPAGTYRLSETLTLHSGVTYRGQGAAILKGNGHFWIMQTEPGGFANTITGLTFDNGGLLLRGVVFKIKITGNTFQNLTADNSKGDWGLSNAIFATDGLRGSVISQNTFKNLLVNGKTRPDGTPNSIDAGNNEGMMLYGIDDTSIDHNTFDHVGEAIHICFTNPYPSTNVYIGYNTFTAIHRMGMEIQGAMGCGAKKPVIDGPNTRNMVIEYNTLTDWADAYWWSYPISLANPAPDGGFGAVVRYNYIVGGKTEYWDKEGPKGKYGYGIEAASANLEVYGNSIKGYWGQSIAVSSSPNASVHDNFACGLDKGATVGMGPQSSPSPGAQYFKNTIIAHHCPDTVPNPVLAASRR